MSLRLLISQSRIRLVWTIAICTWRSAKSTPKPRIATHTTGAIIVIAALAYKMILIKAANTEGLR